MRCKKCDYALWNLTSRQCPECGDPFKPSDFTFNPNAVRFLCPHCGQHYFGTDENGHLEPPAFDCVKCHQPVAMDEMVLLPAEGIHESLTRGKDPESNPWVRRGEIGTSKAGWRTLGRVLGGPGSLMDTPDTVKGRIWHALWFAFILNLAVALLGTAPVLIMAMFPFFTGGGTSLSFITGTIAFVLVPPIVLVAVWAISGLVAHALLRMTGGTRQGLSRSLEAGIYTSAVNIFVCIPCLGIYLLPVTLVWGIISHALMLKRLHAAGTVRALLCASVFPVLITIALIVGGTLFVRHIVQSVGSFRVTYPASSHTWSAGAGLARYASSNNAWPSHGLQLVIDGTIPQYAINPLEYVNEIRGFEVLPGIDQTTFESYTQNQLASLHTNAAAALPPDVIAHRVGDIIFTYHGLPTAHPRHTSDARWIAVWCLHPSRVGTSNSRAAREAHDLRVVVTSDWGRLEYDPTTFPAALAAENQARAALGLAPLPDLENFEWIAKASQPGSQPMPPVSP